MKQTRLIFMGTGTSQGVPVIGCHCPVCSSADPHDKRLRASVYVEHEGQRILVDAGPDFRSQMLREGIGMLDAILLTHNHKDHTGGLDDTRALEFGQNWIPQIYCEPKVLETLKCEYDYSFMEKKYPGAPDWDIHLIDEHPFKIGEATIIPIRGLHGKMPVLGFRFGNIAYLTDISHVDDSEFEKLKGLDAVTVNCVMRTHHHSHFSLPEALEFFERVGARESYITHISHHLPCCKDFEDELPEHIHAAWDGLTIISQYE